MWRFFRLFFHYMFSKSPAAEGFHISFESFQSCLLQIHCIWEGLNSDFRSLYLIYPKQTKKCSYQVNGNQRLIDLKKRKLSLFPDRCLFRLLPRLIQINRYYFHCSLILNPFPHTEVFWHIYRRQLFNTLWPMVITLWKWKKLLIVSNFFFCHNVFNSVIFHL